MGRAFTRPQTQNSVRQVAIKTLPDEVAGDPDRLRRMAREARLLASLNHPNIATIHELIEANGGHALVMEFVEGPTLADLIAAAPIPRARSVAYRAADRRRARRRRTAKGSLTQTSSPPISSSGRTGSSKF